jgi:hypothetical protein
LTLLLALFSVAGCGPSASTIAATSEYGPGASLEGLGSTYAWSSQPPQVSGGTVAENPSLHEAIRGAVDRGLAARGFRGGEPADFKVTYVVGRRTRLDRYEGSGFSEYEEGSLTIELLSADESTLVWRGTAKARIDASDPPEVRRDRIDRAVEAILDRLRPGA